MRRNQPERPGPTTSENGQTGGRAAANLPANHRRSDMATIKKEIALNARPERVWDAMRDFQAVHERVAPGFLLDSKPEDGARFVTFANGSSARELLVTCDDAARRLVYAARNERIVHHNASVQIVADGAESCRFVWIADVLPEEIAGYIGSQMEDALKSIKPTLERA